MVIEFFVTMSPKVAFATRIIQLKQRTFVAFKARFRNRPPVSSGLTKMDVSRPEPSQDLLFYYRSIAARNNAGKGDIHNR